MNPRCLTWIFFLTGSLLILSNAHMASAQPKVTSIERLATPAGEACSNARFSPDGKSVYFSGSGYASIWRYDLASRRAAALVKAPGAGYGFTISTDGLTLGYRSTTTDPVSRRRRFSAWIVDLATGKSSSVASGRDVGIPVMVGGQPVTLVQGMVAKTAPQVSSMEPAVLGIDNTKIILLLGGKRVVLDPYGNGSYIWPSLSPDKTRLVAYELGHGTFVCDLTGRILVTLGRKDAPTWTRDGSWIMYMDDRDDGDRLLSSSINCVSADGRTEVVLDGTAAFNGMNPQCSPNEDRLVCDSPDGSLFLVNFEEGGQ
jgi:Tol biopolymer transport system component